MFVHKAGFGSETERFRRFVRVSTTCLYGAVDLRVWGVGVVGRVRVVPLFLTRRVSFSSPGGYRVSDRVIRGYQLSVLGVVDGEVSEEPRCLFVRETVGESPIEE
jgi:hypothetical protein